MDPEILERLNEQFREMFEILSEQNSMMAAQMKAMKGQIDSSGKVTKAQQEQAEKTSENTKKQEAYAKSEEERQAAVKQATDKINKALDFTAGAFMSLGSAVMDSTQSFQKYNGTIGMMANSTTMITDKLGVFGKVLEGVIKGSTKLLQYQLEQADSLLKFNDQISKMGAMNAYSSEQILEMGNKAGFAAKDLEKLSAPMQKLGSTFKQIGDGAADSTKRFMEMAAVGSETRQEFQRLGYSQEQLVEAQAGYVELLGGAGLSLRSFNGDMKTLQKTSLAYVKNLQVLSDMAGLSAEDQQKRMAAAAADAQFQLYVADMNKKIAAASTEEEKQKLANQVELAMATKAEITALQGEEAGRGFGQALAGAPITEGVGTMSVSGTYGTIQELARETRAGNINSAQEAAKYTQAITDRSAAAQDRLGVAAAISSDVANLVGGTGGITRRNQLFGLDQEKMAADIQKRIDENKEEKGPAAEDEYQQARNALTESEIALRTGFDKLAFTVGPLAAAFIALAGFATAAALSLRGSSALLGRLGSVLGGPGARAATAATAATAGAGAAGAGAAGAGAAGAGAAGAGAAAASTSKLGKLGTMAKGAGRVLGKLAAPLAAGMALYDAYQGFNADADASFGDKLKNAGKSALSGLTFGLLGSSPEEIAKKTTAPAPETDPAKIAQNALQPKETRQPLAEQNLTNSFNTSVAAFGRIVASFGKIVTAFIKTVKASNATTSEFNKNVKIFNSIMKPLTDLASAGSRVKGKNTGLLGGLVNEEEDIDVVEYIEKLKNSLNDTALASDKLREADLKQHKFTEESMKQFRRSLEDLTKTIGGITGIDRTDSKNDDKNSPGGSQGGNGAGSSENAQKAMEYFMKQGWTKEQSAGIVGNLQQESGKNLDPGAENPSSGMYGIAQWDKTRRKQFEKAMGKSIYGSSLEDQLAFIQHELTEGKDAGAKKGGKELRGAKTAAEAATIFEKRYERSGGHAMGKRIANAEALMSESSELDSETPTVAPGDAEKYIAFGGESGKLENFRGLNPDIQQAFTAAAKEYFNVRGRKLSLTSGRRSRADQERLYNMSIEQGTPGRIRWPSGKVFPVARPGTSLHEKADALDTGNYGDPAAVSILNKHGLYQTIKGDLPHFQLKARQGGIFDGPDKGYPVELHGGEMVAPLNQDSILMKLAKTPAEADEISQVTSPSPSAMQKEILERVVNMNSEMMDNMLRKLDDMVSAINDGNDTREKILKNNMN